MRATSDASVYLEHLPLGVATGVLLQASGRLLPLPLALPLLLHETSEDAAGAASTLVPLQRHRGEFDPLVAVPRQESLEVERR